MALDSTIGGAAADSYATLVEYEARATAMGWTLAETDAANEANLRRAAEAIDASYAFVGYRQYQTQARQWPRIVTGLIDGWPVNPDTIPQAVKSAQMEMAYAMQGGTDPMAALEGIVARSRDKAGPVETETEYLGGKGAARITAVDRLLRPYLFHGAGQTRLMRA